MAWWLGATGARWALFLDDDMVTTVGALEHFIKCTRTAPSGLTSGVYAMKSLGGERLVLQPRWDLIEADALELGRGGDWFPCAWFGGGCVLLDRGEAWEIAHRNCLPPLRYRMPDGRWFPGFRFWQNCETPAGEPGGDLTEGGEDVGFCQLAAAAGIVPHALGSMLLGHVGSYVYTPADAYSPARSGRAILRRPNT
jgi:hypothetical protein